MRLGTVNSFRRAVVRASNNPEMLAHAINKTKPTVLMITANPLVTAKS
jgi:hypothetical protein